jgi:hypothetical protein
MIKRESQSPNIYVYVALAAVAAFAVACSPWATSAADGATLIGRVVFAVSSATLIYSLGILAIFAPRKYIPLAVDAFFAARMRKNARDRGRALVGVRPLFDSARAAYAVAHAEGDILNITALYNVLVDQQMLSSARLRAHIPGISTIFVKFESPFADVSARIDVDAECAIIAYGQNQYAAGSGGMSRTEWQGTCPANLSMCRF